MQISNPNSVVNNTAVSRISVTTTTTPADASGCKLVPIAPKEPGAQTDRLNKKTLDSSSILSTVSFYANPEHTIETALKPLKGFSLGGDTRMADFASSLTYFGREGLDEMKSLIQTRMAQPNTLPEDQAKLKQMYSLVDEALSKLPPAPARKPDSGRDFLKDFCG